MKICLINNLYNPFVKGGAEVVVENIVRGLLNKEKDVFVISAGKEKKEDVVDGVKVYRIKPLNVSSFHNIDKKNWIVRLVWWFFMVFNVSTVLQVARIIKKEKPDVVHAHNLVGLSFLLPMYLKGLRDVKYVHTLHDIQLAYPSGQLIYKKEKSFINTFFLRQWYEKLVRQMIGSPDVVISPSSWLLNFYTKKKYFKKSKKLVVVNGVTLNDSISSDKKGIDFVFVGNIERYKGIYLLVDVITHLAEDFSEVRLHVVGGGRDLEKLKEQYCGPNIKYYGRLEMNKVEDVLEKSDVLVMPTMTYENLPTVIISAFIFGLPVVASEIGGIAEMVSEKTGFLFEPGNFEQLYKILEKIIQDNDIIKEMREDCLKESFKYSLERYIEKITSIYESR